MFNGYQKKLAALFGQPDRYAMIPEEKMRIMRSWSLAKLQAAAREKGFTRVALMTHAELVALLAGFEQAKEQYSLFGNEGAPLERYEVPQDDKDREGQEEEDEREEDDQDDEENSQAQSQLGPASADHQEAPEPDVGPDEHSIGVIVKEAIGELASAMRHLADAISQPRRTDVIFNNQGRAIGTVQYMAREEPGNGESNEDHIAAAVE